MTDADRERLDALERRVAAVEKVVADAQDLVAKWAQGPGKKIARLLGITP